MKNSITVAFLLISTLVSAQNFTVEMVELIIPGDSMESTFYDHIELTNTSGAPLDLRWERIEEEVPSAWLTSVCDPMVCHPEAVDSGTFTLRRNTGPNDYLNVHFYPNNQGGAGLVRIRIESVSNPSDQYILTFYGTTNGQIVGQDTTTATAIADFSEVNFSIYPNPVQDHLRITLPSPFEYSKIRVINVIGSVVYEAESDDSQISLTSLVPGSYLLQVFSKSGKLLGTKRFLKK